MERSSGDVIHGVGEAVVCGPVFSGDNVEGGEGRRWHLGRGIDHASPWAVVLLAKDALHVSSDLSLHVLPDEFLLRKQVLHALVLVLGGGELKLGILESLKVRITSAH